MIWSFFFSLDVFSCDSKSSLENKDSLLIFEIKAKKYLQTTDTVVITNVHLTTRRELGKSTEAREKLHI